nr:YihY/virulence factor BrkB family protein [Sphingomonas xinjiangensis]
MRDDYGIVASSIAFASFLSILPLLGLVAVAYSMLVPSQVVASNIATLVDVLPESAQNLVQSWLTNSLARHRPGGVAFLVSAVVTLFGARRAGRSLLHGMNIASGVEQGRGPLYNQLVAIAVVLAGAGLLLSALVSISALALIQNLVPKNLPGATEAFNLLLWGSLTLGPVVALVLTYRYAAARAPVPWLWVLPGTVSAVLLWLGATLAFRFYVGRIVSYGNTYGSLSAVVVLQLWLMLSAYIMLFGAKVNAEALRITRTPGGRVGEHEVKR